MLRTNPSPLSLEIVAPESDDVIRVVGTPEHPEWVAADVCRALGIKQATRAVADFDDTEKAMKSIHTPGGPQEMLTITEVGLFRLVFRSKKAAAKRFQKWVCGEVLPSIRKFGCYPPPAAMVPTDSTVLVLRELADQRETNQALVERVEALEGQLREITAKATQRYITLAGYARLKGVLISQFDAIRHGRELAKLHRKEGVSIGSAPDSRFGRVNSYRLDLMENYFERRKLTK